MVEDYREAIESLYSGRATVTVTLSLRDPVTHEQKRISDVIYTDIPCRLSYSSKNVANEDGMISTANITVTMFTSPEIDIPEGSKVSVLWQGKRLEFKNTSIPAYHETHNEYSLEDVRKVI